MGRGICARRGKLGGGFVLQGGIGWGVKEICAGRGRGFGVLEVKKGITFPTMSVYMCVYVYIYTQYVQKKFLVELSQGVLMHSCQQSRFSWDIQRLFRPLSQSVCVPEKITGIWRCPGKPSPPQLPAVKTWSRG